MERPPNSEDLVRGERRILRLLCQDAAARERLADTLRRYHWRNLAHRVAFEIISSAHQLPAERLRTVLPTRLTNAGFPDFPWEDLYLPCDISAEEAETLIRRLEATGD